MEEQNDQSELKLGEPHPAAHHAMAWFKEWQRNNLHKYVLFREAIASNAISGNRMAEILHGTLERLAKSEPVSDRYLLGLCWFLKEIYIKEDEFISKKELREKINKLYKNNKHDISNCECFFSTLDDVLELLD